VKILMLLSNEYKPDPRVEKEALALQSNRHTVRILAWNRTKQLSEYDFWPFLPTITRVATGKVANKIGMIINYPSFFFKMITEGMMWDFDVVHSHDLDTLAQGVLISKLKSVPLVYDAHEHYAKMVEGDLPKVASSLLDRIEQWLMPNVDLLVAANSMIEEELCPQKDSIVVMNCIDLVNEEKIPHSDFTLFYGGSLEPGRLIEDVVEVLSRHPICTLRIAGDGSLARNLRMIKNKHKNIWYVGQLGKNELKVSMLSSDVVLCLFDPSNANNAIGTPNRLFEAMAFGLSVIATEGTASGKIVEETGCGLVIPWSEYNFIEAVNKLKDIKLREKLGLNGKKAVKEMYNWGIMKTRLIEAYEFLGRGK
jgi:glycosyltransferase involved in cell wall biosynthesis